MEGWIGWDVWYWWILKKRKMKNELRVEWCGHNEAFWYYYTFVSLLTLKDIVVGYSSPSPMGPCVPQHSITILHFFLSHQNSISNFHFFPKFYKLFFPLPNIVLYFLYVLNLVSNCHSNWNVLNKTSLWNIFFTRKQMLYN